MTDPAVRPQAPAAGSLHAVLRFSRFARRLVEGRPEVMDEVDYGDLLGWDRDAMQRFVAAQAPTDAETLAATLRRLRQRVLLRLALRDLAGIAPLGEVHGTMSDLADFALEQAHAFWTRTLETEIGVPTANGVRQELLVVGMGKLGGRELNVSSDIDLIFVFPEDGETVGPRKLSNQEFFQRLGQRVIAMLNDVTGDGQVFRVDMRLRPWGDGGPLATSFAALENYFMVHGREWERYAWIKARVCAGGDQPVARGAGIESRSFREELRLLARPFVYRRYLDFGAIGSLRSLHEQIRREVARRDLAEHVKLGPGGIREVEFIAQAVQLIRAGRDPQLQIQPTVAVLRLLAVKGFLDRDTVRELLDAYIFLRQLEHRLQYLDDAQTHTLPADPADRLLVAQAMGYPDTASFMARLDHHRGIVSRHFAAAFRSNETPRAEGDAAALETLKSVWTEALDTTEAAQALSAEGFADGTEALRRVLAMRSGSRYRALPATSQARLDDLMPLAIRAAARTDAPDATLERMVRLLEAVSGRTAYLAMLQERRDALDKLAKMLGASRWAATYLTSHPVLLDELLDPRLYGTGADADFAAELRASMEAYRDDVERQMDLMRELHHAQVFRLLVQDLAGLLEVETLADHLSSLADAVLAVTVEACWKRLLTRHRETPRFCVIAYGKLGGKELGYASDLDITFLHDDPDPAAQEIYARLGQRIVTWLSSRTGAGLLFETDLRLRPNGEAGLLVTSMDAFRKYQRESAWVWEHQALTRARWCAGDATIGAAFEAERREILMQPRDRQKLAEEVVSMRERMFNAHPNESGLFDVKHGQGGMIDIEFVVQYLVLAHAHKCPTLTGNLGNIALLKMAADLGLLEHRVAEGARVAYRELRRTQHRLRLNDAEFARVPFETVEQHAQAGRALWRAVFGDEPKHPKRRI